MGGVHGESGARTSDRTSHTCAGSERCCSGAFNPRGSWSHPRRTVLLANTAFGRSGHPAPGYHSGRGDVFDSGSKGHAEASHHAHGHAEARLHTSAGRGAGHTARGAGSDGLGL